MADQSTKELLLKFKSDTTGIKDLNKEYAEMDATAKAALDSRVKAMEALSKAEAQLKKLEAKAQIKADKEALKQEAAEELKRKKEEAAALKEETKRRLKEESDLAKKAKEDLREIAKAKAKEEKEAAAERIKTAKEEAQRVIEENKRIKEEAKQAAKETAIALKAQLKEESDARKVAAQEAARAAKEQRDAEKQAAKDRITQAKEEARALKAAQEEFNRSMMGRLSSAPRYTPMTSMIAGMSATASERQAQLPTQLPATPPAPDRKPWDNLLSRILEINIAYRATNALLTEMNRVVHAIPKIGIEVESTRAALTATMGKTGMEITLAELRREAERTGMDVEALRESFRTFSASTSLAGQSLESTWRMFQNINTTATALHFSTDKVTHTFLALSQIFNKSKVQSEELVKQLGNLLPGAFAAFQKANEDLYSTPQKLAEAMKKGLVTAEQTVEKFTNFYAERFSGAFQVASDGFNANLGRMKNSFTYLGEAIYETTGGPLVSLMKTITEINQFFERAIKGENEFILVTKVVIETVGLTLVGAYAKAAIGAAKLKLETEGLAAMLATAKTAALEFKAALLAISGTAVIAGFALVISSLQQINAARRESYEAVKRENTALSERAKIAALSTPIELEVDKSPEVVTAKKELDKFKQDKAELDKQIAKNQTYTNVTGEFKKITEAYKQTTEAIDIAQETLIAKSEQARIDIGIQREKQLEAFIPKTTNELDSEKQNTRILKAQAATLEEKAYIAEKAGKQDEADTLRIEATTKRKQAAMEKVTETYSKFYSETKANMDQNVKGILTFQKQLDEGGPNAKAQENLDRAVEALKENSAKLQGVKKEQEGAISEVNLSAMREQDAIERKRESAAKKATSEREKGIRQDIKSEEQYNKTIVNEAKLASKALDDEYTKRTITFDEYFNKKQAVLDKEYNAEREKLVKIQSLASGSNRRDEQVKAQQELIRLDENKAAADAQIDRDRKTRTEEYKTQLADIRDQYYQILGVEGGDNEITKEKLRLLRQEIALKAEAGDIASQTALKQFDTNQYNKGLFKQMAVAQQGMDTNQRKLNEEIARTNALEETGRISKLQGIAQRTKSNEEYIASQEKEIAKIEADLSKPSDFETSNQLTEKLRAAKAELDNFKLKANEVSVVVEDSLGRAFESTFTGVMSGSMNASQAFKSFANSIGQDILKMAASAVRAQLLSPLIGAMFSGIGGMFSSAFGSSASVAAGNSAAFSGAMSGSNWMSAKLANGGVMSGTGISAYSGSIVSSPTVFPFAAGVGLMGEAGPEAVLPLKRNSQGKLGVTLENGGQSKGNVYNISVNVENKSGESGSQFGEKAAVAIMRTIAKEEIASAKRPGNQLNKSRFG